MRQPWRHAPVCISGNLAFHRQKIRSWSPAWQYRAAQTITCTDMHVIIAGGSVRRLLPVEEERLFGFPDNFTAIRYRGTPASPYVRHNVLGNSWAINCARWVCGRFMFWQRVCMYPSFGLNRMGD